MNVSADTLYDVARNEQLPVHGIGSKIVIWESASTSGPTGSGNSGRPDTP